VPLIGRPLFSGDADHRRHHLGELLERDGPMSPVRAVRVIEQLAGALDAAHVQGLVHRDVKPTNVLISGTTGREFVYLIDFGIAYHSTATKLLRTGSAVSALANTAPQRFTTGTADARADIYALACVLYECLTGRQPFEGDSTRHGKEPRRALPKSPRWPLPPSGP
jgi:serine/threonine protein kinase, bacterial